MLVPKNRHQELKEFISAWKNSRVRDDKYLGDAPFSNFVLTERATSWNDFITWLNSLPGSWCFRGQREASWLLHTPLDRATKVEYSLPQSSGCYHLDRRKEAEDLLKRFRSRPAHHLPEAPCRTDNLISWYGLMQHHGAPTPFLDWSYSPYIAMYFAIEEEPREDRRYSAVWALDLRWIDSKRPYWIDSNRPEFLPPKTFEEIRTRRFERPVIIRFDRQLENKRAEAQRGLFLSKLIHEASFGQHLMSMMMWPEIAQQPFIRKLEVPANLRESFLEKLEEMNITRAALFPDPNLGIGESLALRLKGKVQMQLAQIAEQNLHDIV